MKKKKSLFKEIAESLVVKEDAYWSLSDHQDDLRSLVGDNVEFEDDEGVVRMGKLTNLGSMGGRVEYGKQKSAIVSLSKIARIGTWT
jgi:hypothetical protein